MSKVTIMNSDLITGPHPSLPEDKQRSGADFVVFAAEYFVLGNLSGFGAISKVEVVLSEGRAISIAWSSILPEVRVPRTVCLASRSSLGPREASPWLEARSFSPPRFS